MASLFTFLTMSQSLGQRGFPERLPSTIPVADLTGNWQFIPVPLPDRNVTHILLSKDKDRIFLGTPSGVASYNGADMQVPEFESVDAEQPIFVNSLVEAAAGTVLVGTINDSLWQWRGNAIRAIYGACPRRSNPCPRAEWAFASSQDGTIYVASSSIASTQHDALKALRAAIPDRVIDVQTSASYLGMAGSELVAASMARSR
ncbi:hypothetical protein ACFSOZ_23560 [Mesorhizobium newzealandense]|uniref:Uncharacterized protein n=1 Tax=Mesorhizobium newzealandense TaxID=1300302 RepID=A0ABW4UES8_9HYPH